MLVPAQSVTDLRSSEIHLSLQGIYEVRPNLADPQRHEVNGTESRYRLSIEQDKKNDYATTLRLTITSKSRIPVLAQY
ncbi:unnamed protein product [Protopolystoma xenopodis]|uniref:Uncharacterized protein n=1 Tax=Protopolystoma xenopodis TaxID=117903 RepID=A0A3S5BP95_9PLAT|nr:unnamed protein product [Protopolystoma xenopodis]